MRSLPGESAWASAAYKACCLLVPYVGVRRGLNVFLRASMFAKTPLQMAARANALCMVVRSQDWKPRNGDIIHGCALDAEIDYQASCATDFLEKSTTIGLAKTTNFCVSAAEIQTVDSQPVNQNREIVLHIRAPYVHYAPKSI